MRKYFRGKVFTSLLLFFFIFGSSVYPQQTSSVSDPVSNVGQGVGPASVGVDQVDKSAAVIQPDLNPYNIAVPGEFGQIEEVFQGTPNSPLIIHIQNVHANYEAQVNIKGILNHLVEKYKFSLIQLEGAVSKLDPEILQPSYLKEANLKLVDFLLREGRITGADAFAVETEKPVELYGIEDQSLYMENLKMFKAIYKHQEELKPYFDEVHRLILNIGPKLFDPELLDFTRKTEEFSTDKIDILDYLIFLNALSERHELISLSDLKQMVHYPNLVRLMKLHNLEKELNKSGLKKETEAIKLEFQKKMPGSKQAEELLSRLDESAKGVNPRSYFLELTKLADEAKIDFVAYPAFRIFAEFLIHQDEIDHRGLFSELKTFERFLQTSLFTKEDEKALLEIVDFVSLLGQYFRLEMSREKIVLYVNHQSEIKPSWIAAQLSELAQKYGVPVKSMGDVQKLDPYMGEVEYFYQLVLKRDQVFTEKILSRMKSLGQNKTILVTGGFHRDGLIDHFKKENISYVIVNPKVDIKEGNENYLKVMLGEDAVVGSVYAGTFAAETPNLQNEGQQRNLFRFAYAPVPFLNLLLGQGAVQSVIRETNGRFAKLDTRARLSVRLRPEVRINDVAVRYDVEGTFPDESGTDGIEQVANLEGVRKGRSFIEKVISEKKVSRVRLERKIGGPVRSNPRFARPADFLKLEEALTAVQPKPVTVLPSVPVGRQAGNSLPVDIVVPVKELPPDITFSLTESQLSNPQVARDIRRALEQKPSATEPEVQIIIQDALKARRAVVLTDQTIGQTVEDTNRAAAVKFLDGQVNPVEPRLFALMFEEGTSAGVKESIIAALGANLTNPQAMGFVVGKDVIGYAALLDPAVKKRVLFFETPTDREAIQVMERGLRGKFFNLYRSEIRTALSVPDLQKTPYARMLVFQTESGVALNSFRSRLYGIEIVDVQSKVGRPEVREADLSDAEVARAEMRLLSVIPTSGDAVDYLGRQLGLAGFFNRITTNSWSLGLLSRIKQLFVDWQTATKVAVSA